MKIQYELTEDDFLQQQLYSSSQSQRVKSQRRKSWILLVLAFLAVAYLLSENGNKFMMYATLAVALITLIFYPFFQKQQYLKHYKQFIAETYAGRFNAHSTLDFQDDHIFIHDKTGDSTILCSAIGKIIETTKHMFIQMQTGGALIIPKAGVEDIGSFREKLKTIAKRHGVVYSKELDWKWK